MLKNYLTVALRNLRRDAGFSAINLFGLAVEIAVCLLIFLFVRHQWRADRFHENASRIVRVTTHVGENRFASTPAPVGPALHEAHPAVKEVVRMTQYFSAIAERGPNRFGMEHLQTEPSFFEVFDFDLVAGDEKTALAEPYTAVLSKKAALKLFGPEGPVGQTFMWQNVGAFTVTGILAESPGPSHLDFGLVFSYATRAAREDEHLDNWQRLSRDYTYPFLREGADPASVEAALNSLGRRHWPERVAARRHFQLQPLTDIALGSYGLWNRIQSGGLRWGVLAVLTGLSAVVLLAAGFNYVNLTVARSLGRAKEIGVRKAVGTSAGDVARLLSGGYVALFAGAAVVAVPLAWWLNAQWLRAFAYPVEQRALFFALGVGALLVLMLGAVGSQTLRAARANPAESLRSE